MPLDPQLEAMFAGQPDWGPVRTFPLDALREAVRSSSTQLPPPPVTLAAVSDRTIPGPAGEIPVRIYTPEGSGPFPVVAYFHGGGFVVGDLDTQDMIARGLAAGAESIVVSVDYRLAPEHKFPAAFDDCWAATQWVAANAAELGGDPALAACWQVLAPFWLAMRAHLGLLRRSIGMALASTRSLTKVRQSSSRTVRYCAWMTPIISGNCTSMTTATSTTSAPAQ
jgi:hypothetical protein